MGCSNAPCRISFSPSAKRALLAWFDRCARTLPWRRDRDPYRIWVSEVMLQQTTVGAVVPRFDRFIARFPNLHSLAAADEREVLKEWEGLGYYHRARNLHKAARRIIQAHGGILPNEVDAFAELPGVGRYILGAVLSQAFDRRLPIVEANSTRVLCRLFGQGGDPSSQDVRTWLWQSAEAVLPKRRVGDFNQALMELGATVCTATSPNCQTCPLSGHCQARRYGLQELIPKRVAPLKTVNVREICLVCRRRSRVLLMRRPARGRWPNMWEFPCVTLVGREESENATSRLLNSIGVRARIAGELITVRYSVTRFRMTMVCHEAIAQGAKFHSDYYEDGRWVRVSELRDYPSSSPQRKIAAALLRQKQMMRS